jgi:putative ABC transport system substrate-binding protein
MIRILSALFFLSFSSLLVAKETVNIAIVETLSVDIVTESRVAFVDELQRLLPEKHIQFSVYNAQASEQKATDILASIASQSPPDLVVSVATLATRALYNADALIQTPKLFMVVSAPVEEGIVSALGEVSSRNITGEAHVLDAKVKLDMLDGILRASNISEPLSIALIHSTYPSSTNSVNQLMALEHEYENIDLVAISTPFIEGHDGLLRMSSDITASLHQFEGKLDGYWLSSGPLVELDGLVDNIFKETELLPLFAENIEAVQEGALLGVVSEPQSIGKSAAKKAKRILERKSAEGIPVTKMDTYTVAVNVSTAIKLKLPIPSNYLKLSKNHIYQ